MEEHAQLENSFPTDGCINHPDREQRTRADDHAYPARNRQRVDGSFNSNRWKYSRFSIRFNLGRR